MLYLMMNKVNDKYLVKVGETSNIETRRRAYKSSNPYAIMRSTCAGTRDEEKAAHRLLATMGTKVKETNEWYEVSKEVFEEFYQEGMGKVRPRQRPINFKEEF
jgi:hypothetical protein